MIDRYQDICLGHIVPLRQKKNNGEIPSYECPECIWDDKNEECPDYKPIKIFIFRVEGEIDG